MADDTRRVFVEIVVEDAAAKAKLAGVDHAIDQTGRSAATASTHLNTYGAALHAATMRAGEHQAALIQSANVWRTLGRDAVQFGQSLTMFVTAPIVASTVAVLKFAMDFEQSMVKLVTVSAVTEQNMAQMRDAVLALAPAVGIGPNKLAEALLQVTSTGIRGMEAMQVLEVAAKGSAIGLGDVTEVAKTVTSALAAYGVENLSAAQAGNILYKMVVEGKGELTEFAGVMGRVVGMAAMVGVSMADAASFIATFTRTGGSASEAVTALRNVIQRLEVASKSTTEKALKEMGYSLRELRADIAEKGLTPALIDLINKFGATNDTLGKLFPNVRGLAGVMSVAGAQAKSAAEIFAHLSNSADEMGPAFERTSKTIAFQWAQAKAQLENAAIALGTKLFPEVVKLIPMLERLGENLVKLAQWFGQLSPAIQTTLLYTIAIAAALGPLIFAFGSLARGIGFTKTVLAQFYPAATAATAAVTATTASVNLSSAALMGFGRAATAATSTFLGLTAPVWGVVAAVTALGAVLYLARPQENTEGWRAFFDTLDPPKVAAVTVNVEQLDGSVADLNAHMSLFDRTMAGVWDEAPARVKRTTSVIGDLSSILASEAKVVWEGFKEQVHDTWRELQEFNTWMLSLKGTSKSAAPDLHMFAVELAAIAAAGKLPAVEVPAFLKPETVAGFMRVRAALQDTHTAMFILARTTMESNEAAGVLAGSGLPAAERELHKTTADAKALAAAEKEAATAMDNFITSMHKAALANQDFAPDLKKIDGLLVDVNKSAGDAGKQFEFLAWQIKGVHAPVTTLGTMFMGLPPVVQSSMHQVSADTSALTKDIVNNLGNAFRRIPAIIEDAFTGGGGLKGALKAIGVSLVNAFVQPFYDELGKRLSAAVLKAYGEARAASAAPSAGSWAGAGAAGPAAVLIIWTTTLLSAIKQRNAALAAHKAQMEAVWAAEDALIRQYGSLAAVAEATGMKLSGNFDTMLGELAEMTTRWQFLQSTLEKYGLTMADVSAATASAMGTEKVTALRAEWDALTVAGVSSEKVAASMATDIDALVAQYTEAGVAIPVALQEMLDALNRIDAASGGATRGLSEVAKTAKEVADAVKGYATQADLQHAADVAGAAYAQMAESGKYSAEVLKKAWDAWQDALIVAGDTAAATERKIAAGMAEFKTQQQYLDDATLAWQVWQRMIAAGTYGVDALTSAYRRYQDALIGAGDAGAIAARSLSDGLARYQTRDQLQATALTLRAVWEEMRRLGIYTAEDIDAAYKAYQDALKRSGMTEAEAIKAAEKARISAWAETAKAAEKSLTGTAVVAIDSAGKMKHKFGEVKAPWNDWPLAPPNPVYDIPQVEAPWAHWPAPPSYPAPSDGQYGHYGALIMHEGGYLSGFGQQMLRAHQGLAADEVAIIAQRGERILSRLDTAAFDRLGGLAGLRGRARQDTQTGGYGSAAGHSGAGGTKRIIVQLGRQTLIDAMVEDGPETLTLLGV